MDTSLSQFALFLLPVTSIILLSLQTSRASAPSSSFLVFCIPLSYPPPSDRVVDDLNPVLTFTRREVESLLHFVEEEPDLSQVQLLPHDSMEGVLMKALHFYPHLITKVDEQREHYSYTPPGGI